MPNFFFPFCPLIPSGYLKYHHDMPSIIGKKCFFFLTSALYQVMAFSNTPSISLWTNIYFKISPFFEPYFTLNKPYISNTWSLPRQWMEYLQIKGFMVCPICLCWFKMTLLCWCIWSYVIYHQGSQNKIEKWHLHFRWFI